MEYLLKTNGLTKQYGRHKAVDSVNIRVRQGDIYALIGRNGAGKTTLLKMVSGLANPTKGTVSLFEKSGLAACKYTSRIGTLIEAPGVYPNMSAYDNLRLKELAAGTRQKEDIEELLDLVGLSDAGRKKVKNYSLGMKQRLGIALALIGNPDLVILDEPINGLDPQGIMEIRNLISTLNKERNVTFIISSHILEELAKIATNYGFIHEGVLLEEMTQEELLAKCSERIELKISEPQKACVILENMDIQNYKVIDEKTIYIFERLDNSGEIAVKMAESGVKITGISVKKEALEEYFLNLTGGNHHV